MTKPLDLIDILGKLAAAYPNANITEATAEVYAEDLADLPLEDLQAAAQKHRLTSKWFPTVAELREAAVSIRLPPQRSGAEAWGDVLAAIAEHGYYHPPGNASVLAVGGPAWDFPDPITGAVVAGLGWRELCMSENQTADRARFIDGYEQRRDRAYTEARLTPALLALQAGRQADARQLTAAVTLRLSAPATRPQPTNHEARP